MSHKCNFPDQQFGGCSVGDIITHQLNDPLMGKRIVVSIVDDDQAVRESTKQLIRALGYEPHAFSSAEEFLTSEILCVTDCVITDIRMSGMSGIELQNELRTSGSRLPFIFITASTESSERTHAMAAGAQEFLNKPFSDERLASCLKMVLTSRGG